MGLTAKLDEGFLKVNRNQPHGRRLDALAVPRNMSEASNRGPTGPRYDCPNSVDDKQLQDLHLKVVQPEKKD